MLIAQAYRTICGRTFFSYKQVEHHGDTLHILAAGIATPEQKIVHQVALSAQEVTGLQQSKARPTPAGLLLAFLRNEHWVRSTTESRDLATEPQVVAADIPDASEQKKWKELTGHKNDVRIFLTPPYDKHCLAIFPPACTPENILELLHESQWLTPNRGWGQAFLVSDEVPEPNKAKDGGIIVTNAHIADEAAYQGVPLLRIEQHIETSPSIIPAKVTDDHYQYTECPDYDIFDIPPPGVKARRRMLQLGIGIILTATVGIGAYFGFFRTLNEPTEEQLTAEQRFILAIGEMEDSHDAQLKSLEAEFRKQHTVKNQAILECIRIFTEDAYRCGGHPNNMLTLLRLADTIGIDGELLCLRYLDKVISSYRHEDWIRENTTTEEITEWKHLLSRSATLKKSLKYEAKYRDYMRDIILRTEKTLTQPSQHAHS